MKNFINNRTVNFQELEESGIYSKDLLGNLFKGNYNYLNEVLTPEDRENKEFMEPLLYAVKNEKNTYMVYKYYGKNLQEDLGLLIEVVSYDPKIIENTPISNNREFMLDIVELRPSAVMYVSETLKSDPKFIEELHEFQDKGVESAIALLENPQLANNIDFMKEAIIEDTKFLEFASEELKNNYEFIKDVTKQNYAAVEYVIQKRDNFGLEGIKGAKETTRELTVEDYMTIINEMAEKGEDDRYRRVKEKVAEKGADDPRVIKWITAMAAQNKENISTENFKKVFDNAMLTMTKIQKDLTDDKKIKISKENAYELITPRILSALREAAIEKGLEITPEQEELFKEYEEFHREYQEKLTEKKKEELKNKENKSEEKYNPKDIEKSSANSKLSEIQAETTAIREEITAEKQQIKENDELGEK